jgi:hypothetical protein
MRAGRQGQSKLTVSFGKMARRPKSDHTLTSVLSGAQKLGSEGALADLDL